MCSDNFIYISYSNRLQCSCEIWLFWFTNCRNMKWLLHSCNSLKFGISILLFTFVSSYEKCFGIEIILLLLLLLITKHFWSYQYLCTVCKTCKLPRAISLRWSSLTLWFCVTFLWLMTCILKLSNCSRKLVIMDVAFAESASIIGVD